MTLANVERARAFIERHDVRSDFNTAVVRGRAFDKGVEVTVDDRRKAVLSHGGASYRLSYSRTTLNRQLARRCTMQKEVTSRILRHAGLPAPENAVFSSADRRRAWQWAKPILPVVVKPSHAQQGASVFADLRDRKAFDAAFRAVAAEYDELLVERFTPGHEHRVVVVDGEVVAATRRVPASVVGDGRSDVATLVEQKNRERERRANPVHKSLELDDAAVQHLRRQGLRPTSVPAAGRRVPLKIVSSLVHGGDAVDATDDLRPEEVRLAQKAVAAFGGLRVAGLDMLLPRDGSPGEPAVLEINDHPGMSMHYFPWEGPARDPAGRMLEAMFGPLEG